MKIHKFKYIGNIYDMKELKEFVELSLKDKKEFLLLDDSNKIIPDSPDSLILCWASPITVYEIKKKGNILNTFASPDSPAIAYVKKRNDLLEVLKDVKENIIRDKEENLIPIVVKIAYQTPDKGHMGFPGEGYDWNYRNMKLLVPEHIVKIYHTFNKLNKESLDEIREIIINAGYNPMGLSVELMYAYNENLYSNTPTLETYAGLPPIDYGVINFTTKN